MAALDFPTSPTLGQTYTANSRTWKWNGSTWIALGTGPNPIAIGPTAPVNPDAGDLWWDNVTGVLSIYDVDLDPPDWVATQVGAAGPAGADGPVGPAGSPSPRSMMIVEPQINDNITFFYTSPELSIASIRAVIVGTETPSVTYSVYSGSNRSTVVDTHVDAAVLTNTTSGALATLVDTVIQSNSWVWVVISAVSGTVSSVSVNLEF